MTEDSSEQNGSSLVLLDNNIIQFTLNKDVSPFVQKIYRELEKIGARLGISQIVVYESLKAIIFNEKKFNEVKNFLENSLTRYPIDEEVLVQAARVHELYGCDDSSKSIRSGISTEDIIIATTSMLLGAYVMTCDANDFPAPYFKEVYREFVYFKSGGRRKHLVVYIFQPDSEAVEAGLEKLSPPEISRKMSKS